MAVAPEPGTILLEKYCVERVLGRGGMGFVVAVRHTGLGELFAIKLLRPDLQNKLEAHERFLREAKALARLKGEHAVRVQDVGTLDDGAPYMLMEHLQGKDLKQVLEERGPLPLEDVALYVMQACDAIAEAHDQGIIHRDLKPANLFLTTRPNGTPCVKVLDFGISKDTMDLSPGLTRTGAFIGSPAYVSPERLANNKVAHAQSDIWAIGVILYELIDGRVPFRSKILTDLVAKILSTPHVPLNERRPGIPDEFEAIVQRCLEKRPERRYQSVRDIIYDLEPFVAQPQRPQAHRNAAAPMVSPQVEKTVLIPMNAPANPPPIVDEPTTVLPMPRPRPAQTDPMPQMPNVVRMAPSLADVASGERMAQTTQGWGNTWDVLTGRDKKPLILAGSVVIATLAVVILYIVMSPASDDASSRTAPAEQTPRTTKPTVTATAPTAVPSPITTAAPVDVAPVEDTPPPTAAPSAQPAPPTTATTKPRITTKQKTIRGYDE